MKNLYMTLNTAKAQLRQMKMLYSCTHASNAYGGIRRAGARNSSLARRRLFEDFDRGAAPISQYILGDVSYQTSVMHQDIGRISRRRSRRMRDVVFSTPRVARPRQIFRDTSTTDTTVYFDGYFGISRREVAYDMPLYPSIIQDTTLPRGVSLDTTTDEQD